MESHCECHHHYCPVDYNSCNQSNYDLFPPVLLVGGKCVVFEYPESQIVIVVMMERQ